MKVMRISSYDEALKTPLKVVYRQLEFHKIEQEMRARKEEEYANSLKR